MRLVQSQIQQRAEAVGWDLHVPLFDLNEWEQLVSESERLKQTAQSVERKYDVVLPHPYAEWWLTPLPEWFQEMSRSGMDLSSFDLSNADMYTWVRMRCFLESEMLPPELFGWAVPMNKAVSVMTGRNRFTL